MSINAGEHGDELADFVEEEMALHPFDETAQRIVASRVVKRLIAIGLHDPPKTVAPEKPKPMSDAQEKAFGDQEMTFGLYKGVAIRNVPREYLCYMVDPNKFSAELKRYLDNPGIQQEPDV